MPFVRLPDGTVVHIRTAKPRRHRCSAAGCLTPATIQCDYPRGNGRTCDAWCCPAHAVSVGPDLDHCPGHAHVQAGLFTELLP